MMVIGQLFSFFSSANVKHSMYLRLLILVFLLLFFLIIVMYSGADERWWIQRQGAGQKGSTLPSLTDTPTGSSLARSLTQSASSSSFARNLAS
jgi:hypothetical protein